MREYSIHIGSDESNVYAYINEIATKRNIWTFTIPREPQESGVTIKTNSILIWAIRQAFRKFDAMEDTAGCIIYINNEIIFKWLNSKYEPRLSGYSALPLVGSDGVDGISDCYKHLKRFRLITRLRFWKKSDHEGKSIKDYYAAKKHEL